MSGEKLSEADLKTFGESLDALLDGVPVLSQLALLFARLDWIWKSDQELTPPQLAKMFLDGCSLSRGAKDIESMLEYRCKVIESGRRLAHIQARGIEC